MQVYFASQHSAQKASIQKTRSELPRRKNTNSTLPSITGRMYQAHTMLGRFAVYWRVVSASELFGLTRAAVSKTRNHDAVFLITTDCSTVDRST